MKRYHRIVGIDDFGYFQGWEDAEERAPHSFGWRSVIYGPNGSGKSTLASIFHAVEQSQADDEAHPGLAGVRLELTDGTEVTEPSGTDSFPRTIVFGREYIDRNLRQAFEADDGIGTPLFAVGEEQADLIDDLKRVTASHAEADRAATDARTAADEADKRYSEVLDRIRDSVVERLSIADPKKYHRSVYKKKDAEALIAAHPDSNPLADEELHEHLQVVAQRAEDLPDPIAFTGLPPMPKQLHENLVDFAAREIVTESIDRLANSPALATWAQHGLDLHQTGDDCAFCGSLVTQDRVEALRAHFDDAYRELQQTARRLAAELETLSTTIDAADTSLSGLRSVGGPVGRWIADHDDALLVDLDAYRSWAEATRHIVTQRQQNPLTREDWHIPDPPSRGAWQELATAIDGENRMRRERADNLDAAKATATHAVLGHIAASHRHDYDAALDVITGTRPAAEEAGRHVQTLARSLADLQRRQRDGRRDARKAAEDLSDDLARYLGFRGLSVRYDAVDGVAGFRFLRDGKPAVGLSEGERGAIALLYFLRRLGSDEIVQSDPDGGAPVDTLNECVVVIDDPVSSFDNDSLLTAYAYLRDRLDGSAQGRSLSCAQLIVLTHNYHFLRLFFTDFIDKALKYDRKKEHREMQVHTLPDRRATFLDLRPTLVAGDPVRRTSRLRDIGGSRASRSEYHLLFEEVCHACDVGDQARLLLAGNAARRMLESFVYWKWPHAADYATAVRELGRDCDVPRPVTEQVLRTTNHVSHRVEIAINEPQHVGDLAEDLRSVLRFMRDCDPDHFERMCLAQNVTSPKLGPDVPRPAGT